MDEELMNEQMYLTRIAGIEPDEQIEQEFVPEDVSYPHSGN